MTDVWQRHAMLRNGLDPSGGSGTWEGREGRDLTTLPRLTRLLHGRGRVPFRGRRLPFAAREAIQLGLNTDDLVVDPRDLVRQGTAPVAYVVFLFQNVFNAEH